MLGIKRPARVVAPVVVVLLCVAASFVLTKRVALADVPCLNTSYGNYFDGDSHAPNAGERFVGTSAVVSTKASALCYFSDSGYNSVAVWAMIAGGGNAYQYAQSGYINQNFESSTGDPDPCLADLFSEYNDGAPSDFVDKFGYFDEGDNCLGMGSSFNYWEQYDSSCSCEHLNINSTQFDSTPFDPLTTWTGTFTTEFFGEAGDPHDSMAGTQSDPVVFEDLEQQNYTGLNFSGLGCPLTPTDQYWGGPYNANCQLFSIWN